MELEKHNDEEWGFYVDFEFVDIAIIDDKYFDETYIETQKIPPYDELVMVYKKYTHIPILCYCIFTVSILTYYAIVMNV